MLQQYFISVMLVSMHDSHAACDKCTPCKEQHMCVQMSATICMLSNTTRTKFSTQISDGRYNLIFKCPSDPCCYRSCKAALTLHETSCNKAPALYCHSSREMWVNVYRMRPSAAACAECVCLFTGNNTIGCRLLQSGEFNTC